jgi:hypothetical protein
MTKFAAELKALPVAAPTIPEKLKIEKPTEIIEDIDSSSEPIPVPQFGPAYVAKTDPRAYIKTYRYHKNPKLHKITQKMMLDIADNNPEQFFSIGLNSTKYWDLKQWKELCAENLIEKDPIKALETYKLHRDPDLRHLSKKFWDILWTKLSDKEADRLLEESRFFIEVRYLARMLSMAYPEYYLKELAGNNLFGEYVNIAKRVLEEKGV